MSDITTKRRRLGIPARFGLGALPLMLLSGCGQQTLFQSNFGLTAVGQPPASSQTVGTAAVAGPPGSVVAVASPVQSGGRWLQIARPADPSSIVAFQGTLSQFAGDGSYTTTATLFIPSGQAVASLQFEQFGQPVGNSFNGFMHLDFLRDGTVRIDDRAETVFGTFPHDQPFIVQVTLAINATPTAHIVLAGAGANGQADYKILPPYVPMARQFGAVRLWMGTPWAGPYDTTNIVVTKAR
jgi:hypothetical protein